jgi:hypothetical protein
VALAAAGLMISATVAAIYTGYAPVAAAESLIPAWAPELRLGTPRPLELLSLRHSTAAGTFTITGLVQNPSSGTAVRDVLAVVYLFDRDGDFFASGKAPLEFALLEPGGESPFVVRVPTSMPVRRYRVGFRYGAGGVVAHVDRRGLPPASTTGDALDAPRLPPRAAAAWGESDGRR